MVTKEPVLVSQAEETRCYHCGADCGRTKVQHEDLVFCCQGCSTVYQILAEKGLNAYYRMNAFPGSQSKSTAYGFLDETAIAEQILDFNEGDQCRVTLRIPAIHCTSCIWLLENLFQVQEGILRSEVNFGKKEAYFHFNAKHISLRELVELLDRLGYAPALSLDDLEGKPGKSLDRRIILQLGVTGFCFGNIMMLSFPEYFGIANLSFANFFGYLNLILALPVIFYGAIDYFRSAWQGLRHRSINMDIPIAMGIAALILRSGYEIISHTGAGYLDSMAGLVFFLLIGKLYQSKTYALLAFDRDYKSYFPISVTRVRPDAEQSIALSELEKGDRLLIRNGELIPADAVLIQGEAWLDYSFVTGESEPVPKEAGEVIYAGGRQSGSSIVVETVKDVSQSYLTQLWGNEAFQKGEESGVTALSNRASRTFTIAILVIAFVSAIAWLVIEPARVVWIVSAVLIVACPCALALATPFSLGNALRILGRNGLFVKGPAVIEQLALVDTIVFDKTGTLTRPGAANIQYEGEPLSEKDLSLLRSLLKHSTHPLSRQLFAFLEGDIDLQVEEFTEVGGRGLSAKVEGEWVKIGSAAWVGLGHEPAGNGTEVHFSISGGFLGCFKLENVYREGLEGLVNELGEDYEMVLLTGDGTREKASLEAYFPEKTRMLFRQSPQDKLDYIRQGRDAGQVILMIGDGLNDAGALRQSQVGISITEDISAFTPASDAIMSAEAFNKIPAMLRFSKNVIRLIHASFLLSLFYNLIGLAFAVTGNLSPLVAAILMPVSSVSVVVLTSVVASLLARKFKSQN